MSRGNLLLENSILLTIDVSSDLFCLLFKVIFELFVLSCLPDIQFLLCVLGILLTLMFLLFFGSFSIMGISGQAIHVTLSLFHEIIIVFTLKNSLICTKNSLELNNLVVESVLLLSVI